MPALDARQTSFFAPGAHDCRCQVDIHDMATQPRITTLGRTVFLTIRAVRRQYRAEKGTNFEKGYSNIDILDDGSLVDLCVDTSGESLCGRLGQCCSGLEGWFHLRPGVQPTLQGQKPKLRHVEKRWQRNLPSSPQLQHSKTETVEVEVVKAFAQSPQVSKGKHSTQGSRSHVGTAKHHARRE